MKALVLSALDAATAPAVTAALDASLRRAGYHEVTQVDVQGDAIGTCQGEFDCWLATPGRCKIQDRQQEIVEAFAASDAVLLVGRVSFGGFSFRLKRSIDRLICLVAPFFEKRAALTHHERRYARYPSLFAIGLGAGVSDEVEVTFDALSDANALNLFAPRRGSVVLDPAETTAWEAPLAALFATSVEPGATITGRAALREALLAAAAPEAPPVETRIETAAVLVGSPKPKGTSTSEQIARAFVRHLATAGVACDLHFASEFVHERPASVAQAAAIARADLFLLATPLYVDALPALTTHALELVATARAHTTKPSLFVPVINCGFPEPEHVRTALRITRHFAHAAHYVFAGALPLGAGGVVAGRSLEDPHGPVVHVARAIELASAALAIGHPVPGDALEQMLRAPLPDFLYRFAGDLGFRLEAHRHGLAQRDLRAHPLAK